MRPTNRDCIRRVALTGAVLLLSLPIAAQPPRSEVVGAETYVVFVGGRSLGREELAVVRQADGWVLRGSSRLGAPLATAMRQVELRYDPEWRPRSLSLDGTVQGNEVTLETTFADGKATNRLTEGGKSTEKVDAVSSDALVLPNVFLSGYAALAAKLSGAVAGTEVRGYIAPQGEIPIAVTGVADERIETPRRAFAARRYSLLLKNPGGDMAANLWAEASGTFLRLSVPAQTLEVAREDVASAASRTAAFAVPGDESVRIGANGFNLAATVTRAATTAGRAPAVVLVSGADQGDRDGTVAGIPMMGQIARDLSAAGFVVVRYDRRGAGQSGGRAETAALVDYAEDARAVVTYLKKERRRDVDDKRIAVLGHDEGAWIAMRLAATEKSVAALVMVAGGSERGGALILEQQQHMLAALKVPDDERKAKSDLQNQIHQAVLGRGSWEGIPKELRAQAETAWFASYLAFEPGKQVKDVRQPIFIVHGSRDAEVAPRHADALAVLARARKRQVPVDVATIDGANHLLVPSATGEVEEYPSLAGKDVSREATTAVARWLTTALAGGR